MDRAEAFRAEVFREHEAIAFREGHVRETEGAEGGSERFESVESGNGVGVEIW